MNPKIKKERLAPLVVIAGRINVGKSTLFNKLIGENKALMSPTPGTTRDVNSGFVSWRGRTYELYDTGGFLFHPQTEIEKKVFEHAKRALAQADLILFVVDGKVGLHPDDRTFLAQMRKLTKSQIKLVINKLDKRSELAVVHNGEWKKCGLGAPSALSAVSGIGTGDLLDLVHTHFLKSHQEKQQEDLPTLTISIIGRPNVGKSSILNALFGEERVIVSSIPHTTREPHDSSLEYNGRRFIFIDTVGIRRKNAIRLRVESEGVDQSIKNIKRSDMVMLILESTVTPSKQESRLLSIAVQEGIGVLLVINKWDLIDKKTTKMPQAFEEFFRKALPFVPWAPMCFVSALTNQRISKLLDEIATVHEEREKILSQKILDEFIARAISKQAPSWIFGKKKPVIYGFRQVGNHPPTFSLLVKERITIDYNYLRYLENRLRELYGFKGTPIRIHTEQHVIRNT